MSQTDVVGIENQPVFGICFTQHDTSVVQRREKTKRSFCEATVLMGGNCKGAGDEDLCTCTEYEQSKQFINQILHNVVIRTSENDGGFILFHEQRLSRVINNEGKVDDALTILEPKDMKKSMPIRVLSLFFPKQYNMVIVSPTGTY